jgi:tetratricopeptide (TPR) repeat protein
MNWRRIIVFNRLPIAIALIAIGILATATTKSGIYYSWLLWLVALVMIAAHFLIGPMSLIQKNIEEGDIDGAKALLAKVKKPDWLYKPVRSAYYMLKTQLSSLDENQDLKKTKEEIYKGLQSSGGQKDVEGSAYVQLGIIAMKEGNNKEAYANLKKAIQLGLPNKDAEAAVYLQLSGVCIQRQSFKEAKMYYNKCVGLNSKDAQVKEQLAEMKKYISRIPG